MSVPTGAADLTFEGGGERLVVAGTALQHVAPYATRPGHSVLFEFSEADARAFADLTGRLVGQELAVSICGDVVSRPVIRERIGGGRGIIPVESVEQAVALTEALRGEAPCPVSGGS